MRNVLLCYCIIHDFLIMQAIFNGGDHISVHVWAELWVYSKRHNHWVQGQSNRLSFLYNNNRRFSEVKKVPFPFRFFLGNFLLFQNFFYQIHLRIDIIGVKLSKKVSHHDPFLGNLRTDKHWKGIYVIMAFLTSHTF